MESDMAENKEKCAENMLSYFASFPTSFLQQLASKKMTKNRLDRIFALDLQLFTVSMTTVFRC